MVKPNDRQTDHINSLQIRERVYSGPPRKGSNNQSDGKYIAQICENVDSLRPARIDIKEDTRSIYRKYIDQLKNGELDMPESPESDHCEYDLHTSFSDEKIGQVDPIDKISKLQVNKFKLKTSLNNDVMPQPIIQSSD